MSTRFLLSNDDGIDSPGLHALARVLAPRGALVVAAPDAERSGSSHAFTHRGPVAFRETELFQHQPAYAVAGTPVDCVKVGLFLEGAVDWVVSGINLGANVGVDAFYSGTIGAACEGALQGHRGIAFSLELLDGEAPDLDAAARLCALVLDQVLVQELPPGTCLNVNLPALPPERVRGIWTSAQAMQRYLPHFEWGPEQNGRRVLIKESKKVLDDHDDGGDYARLSAGWITVTPLSLNRTDPTLLEAMRAWTWTL